MYITANTSTAGRITSKATTINISDAPAANDYQINKISGVNLINYCAVGTFGLLSPLYLAYGLATSTLNINQVEIKTAYEIPVDSFRTSAQDIAHIRKVMKISMTELAGVFGVSRQAVHEWAKGTVLSQRNAERVSDLAKVADVFVEADINVTPQALRRKIANGPSILETAKENGNSVELARILVVTLRREQQQRQRLDARLAGRALPNLTADDFGAPHFNEKL